ncbi:MAG TPA: hypothetical protein VFT01_06790 [Homoserinimonas sp.]|nr:hypothetical protein [Homoserinimonas sp.]
MHVVPAEPDSAAAACADHGLGTKWGSGPMLHLVVPDMGERPGWRKLAPNLYAEED